MKLVGKSRIVVVGRQVPPPSAVQACAEALTGAACTRLAARQWYQRIDAVHELTDGRLVATVIPTASPRRSGAGSPCSSYSKFCLHCRQPEREKRGKRGACIDPHGFDAGKLIKGKKRHILVDTLGLLLHALVTPPMFRIATVA